MQEQRQNYEELTQEELEQLEAEALPKREVLSVIGPLPADPGTTASDLPEIVDAPE
jgi:hypothetical protein